MKKRKIKQLFSSFLSPQVFFAFLLFACFSEVSAFENQQPGKIKVSGTVSDTKGETVIGATVVVKGSNNSIGTVTDIDGKYTLDAVPADGVLQFSSLGMGNLEIRVNNSKTINVVMKENTILLDQTVVLGYGSVKKSDLTGSVSSVKTDLLNNTPSNSIDGLLQGRAAGLQVINSSQDPGAGSTIRIRGGSSLRGSNSPLVVVDGFPLGEAGNLKQVNPADIVSIEVLKDASASAIYGSRGANGVIMVTTKKAKSGTTSVMLRQQTTISQFTSKLVRWDNLVLMAQLSNESRINGNLPPLYIGEKNSNGVYFPSVSEIADGTWPHSTRWDEVVFRDAPISNNTSLSINSANEKTSFNLNLNYFDDKGVYIKDDFKKGIVKLGVDHKIFDNLTIRTSNLFSKNFRNSNGGLAYYRNPLWPVFNSDGSYFLAGKNDYSHPLAITNNVTNKNQGLDYISSWMLDFQINKDFNLKSQVNYKYGSSITDRFNPRIYTSDGDFNNGAAYVDNWMGENIVSETYLTYDKQLAKKHKVSAMVGHSFESSQQRTSSLSSYGFVNEAIGNEDMSAGKIQKNKNGRSQSKLLSFMGRANYTFDDKYLFTVTMRADGSTKFGENNKWAYFPSGALSWKAHHEKFIKDLNVFDELKVRASYGISGNQGISPYQTLSRYGVEEYFDQGEWKPAIGPGYVVGSEGDDYRFKIWGGIPNVNLKWETTAQYNIGTDMAFLNRRLRFTFDAYVKNTSNLLRERILTLSSGYDRMWVNDGEISNKGIEFTVEGDMISQKDFSLSGTLMFSKNKNKVISLGDALASGLKTDYNTGMKYEYWGTSLSQFHQRPNILAVGQPVNVFYGYKVNGIVQTEAEGLAAGLKGWMSKPGEFKYVDVSGNGIFDENEDRTIIGDPNPDFMASLGLNGTYKKFDFEIFINGVFGNDVLFQNMWGGQSNTMPLRWTPDNPNNNYPSLKEGRTYYLSDWYVKDGSFVRIQSLSVGYNIAPKNIKWMSNARIYMNAANLYTFSGFKGYDPEVGTDGIYWGGYPRLRNWTIGLDITF